MSKFLRSSANLKRLADNSFSALDQGAYDLKRSLSHDTISLKRAILLCRRAPLITEIKFSSPSQGKIRDGTLAPHQIATTMVRAGAIGLSVLTQPYLFDGSIDYLAQIRKAVNVPILMKDIIVSRIQIDAGRQVGADCILLIKAIFDHDFAEENLETLMSYAESKGMQVLLEVHSDQEFADVLETKHELIGINNRNLETLEVDINNTRNLLTNHDKNNSLIISESGIKKQEDIKYLRSAGADGFLVGTSIMKANDIAAKVGELYNSL